MLPWAKKCLLQLNWITLDRGKLYIVLRDTWARWQVLKFSYGRTNRIGIWILREEINCTWAVPILFYVAAVVLGARGGVDSDPAVLTIIAQAMDVTAEVGSIMSSTLHSMTLITYLVIKDVWLDFHLCTRKWTGPTKVVMCTGSNVQETI